MSSADDRRCTLLRGRDEMTSEDLIESAPPPKSGLRRRVEAAGRHPAGAAAILVLGLIVGWIGGYAVGQGNPRTLAGLGYLFIGSYPPAEQPLDLEPFEQTYGRPLPPTLTQEDLSAIGETVTRQFSVLSARSMIPVMCGTSLGQPGAPNYLDLQYPATVFRVNAAEISQLIWPRPDETAASGTLHTLVTQAQRCPDEPLSRTTVTTSGVLTGIGDEYAIFFRQPTAAGEPDAFSATVTLVRIGADLIEVALISDVVDPLDARLRCLQIAAAAAQKAYGS